MHAAILTLTLTLTQSFQSPYSFSLLRSLSISLSSASSLPHSTSVPPQPHSHTFAPRDIMHRHILRPISLAVIVFLLSFHSFLLTLTYASSSSTGSSLSLSLTSSTVVDIGNTESPTAPTAQQTSTGSPTGIETSTFTADSSTSSIEQSTSPLTSTVDSSSSSTSDISSSSTGESYHDSSSSAGTSSSSSSSPSSSSSSTSVPSISSSSSSSTGSSASSIPATFPIPILVERVSMVLRLLYKDVSLGSVAYEQMLRNDLVAGVGILASRIGEITFSSGPQVDTNRTTTTMATSIASDIVSRSTRSSNQSRRMFSQRRRLLAMVDTTQVDILILSSNDTTQLTSAEWAELIVSSSNNSSSLLRSQSLTRLLIDDSATHATIFAFLCPTNGQVTSNPNNCPTNDSSHAWPMVWDWNEPWQIVVVVAFGVAFILLLICIYFILRRCCCRDSKSETQSSGPGLFASNRVYVNEPTKGVDLNQPFQPHAKKAVPSAATDSTGVSMSTIHDRPLSDITGLYPMPNSARSSRVSRQPPSTRDDSFEDDPSPPSIYADERDDPFARRTISNLTPPATTSARRTFELDSTRAQIEMSSFHPHAADSYGTRPMRRPQSHSTEDRIPMLPLGRMVHGGNDLYNQTNTPPRSHPHQREFHPAPSSSSHALPPLRVTRSHTGRLQSPLTITFTNSDQPAADPVPITGTFTFDETSTAMNQPQLMYPHNSFRKPLPRPWYETEQKRYY